MSKFSMIFSVFALVFSLLILGLTLARAESGIASIYGCCGDGYHGKRTASGAIFNTHSNTAAHKTLPFGTRVLVTNRNNGRSCSVLITDRGPFVRGRVIDVGLATARCLGFSGLAPVTLTVLH